MDDRIKKTFNIPDRSPSEYSSLTLAFLGDAVYEIVIRTVVVARRHGGPGELNRESSELAKAGTQAKIMYAIMDELTPEELSVYKRGRNAHSSTKAKNASVVDYRVATGFESLMGYLYLKDEEDRILELVRMGLDAQAHESAES